MAYKALIYERLQESEGAIARITFNKPERHNVLDKELSAEFYLALDEAEADDSVKVVVIRGNGPSFCAGYDLKTAHMEDFGPPPPPGTPVKRPPQRVHLNGDRKGAERLRRIFLFPKPTIAQVHGYCFGGGLYVATCCDITIAAEDAKMGHVEQRMGHGGATHLMILEIFLIGWKRARELMLTGRVISGKEASDIGWVNRAVPADKLDEETYKLAKAVALMPRDGISIGKAQTELVYELLGMTRTFTQGAIGHSLFENIKFGPDEFNFLKERRNLGVRGAMHARDDRYKGLV